MQVADSDPRTAFLMRVMLNTIRLELSVKRCRNVMEALRDKLERPPPEGVASLIPEMEKPRLVAARIATTHCAQCGGCELARR